MMKEGRKARKDEKEGMKDDEGRVEEMKEGMEGRRERRKEGQKEGRKEGNIEGGKRSRQVR